MGLFVPLDVEYQSDPKIIRAGALAELLYLRSLAMAKRLLTDGFIDAAHLTQLALGIPGRAARHVEALVTESLWLVVEGGWRIAAWERRNQSRAEIEEGSRKKKEAGLKGNHERWHTTGQPSRNCRYCDPNGTTDPSQGHRTPDRKANRIVSPESESESESETELLLQSSTSSTSDAAPDDDDDRDRQAWAQAEHDLAARQAERPDQLIRDPDAWLRAAHRRRLDQPAGATLTHLTDRRVAPLDDAARAQQALMDRNDNRRNRPACPTCGGTRWAEPDIGTGVNPCPDCAGEP